MLRVLRGNPSVYSFFPNRRAPPGVRFGLPVGSFTRFCGVSLRRCIVLLEGCQRNGNVIRGCGGQWDLYWGCDQLSSTDNPVVNLGRIPLRDRPETIVGQVIDLVLSFVALAVLGFIVGVFGSLSAVSEGTVALENGSALVCKEGKKWSRFNAFLFVFVLAPLIAAVPSVSIALIISQLKNWSYLEGLKFVGSQVLGLSYTLGDRSLDVSNPDEVFESASLVLEIFVATWSLAAHGAILGVLINTSGVVKFCCFLERREVPSEEKEPQLPDSDDDRMGYRGWHQARGVERTHVDRVAQYTVGQRSAVV